MPKALSPTIRKARKYADLIQTRHPGNTSAWGIAYDAYLTAIQEMADSSETITPEERTSVERLIKNKYTQRGIMMTTGLELSVIKRIAKEYRLSLT